MKKILGHTFEELICLYNLFLAWREFVVGKKYKKDVQEFSRNLFDNILSLHEDLEKGSYRHGGYESFFVNDPKRRHIHKASVRDRLLHHAVYRILYPFFDQKFIADSYSCRLNKGTHKAIYRFRQMAYKVLPLGNLTSQLFANVYMNEFDQWVKHKLKVKFYIRYADDFVFLSEKRNYLELLIPAIGDFLKNQLKLSLHPDKVFIKTLASGVDFLGWINFPDHRVLRNTTRRRMLRRIFAYPAEETLQSYLGLLGHGNTTHLRDAIKRSLKFFKI